ncbi:MAG TPA: aldehyde dehydrogenase family protein, partial [Armatimonadota bacterium]|nr:aldehyde dehydrogenase family protein [Armatimonadota bacterium]
MTEGGALSAVPLYELPSISPVDGSVIDWHQTACPESLPRQVDVLRERGGEWAAAPLRARLGHLRRLREILTRNAGALAETLAREAGKPAVEAYGADILSSLRSLAWLE